MVFATVQSFRHVARSLGVRDARGFQSKFGARPETLALTWNLMDIGDAANDVKPVHLLWTTMFLKTYSKESVLADTANVCRDTFRKYNYLVLHHMASLRPHVVSALNVDRSAPVFDY